MKITPVPADLYSTSSPYTQPDLFSSAANTGASRRPPRVKASGQSDQTLEKCVLDFSKFTGLDLVVSNQIVVAIVTASLCGAQLSICGHLTWCAALHVLNAYDSGIRLALTIAAKIIRLTPVIGGSERSLGFLPTIEDACQQPARRGPHVMIGTEGPFRAFGEKALPLLDRFAAAIRGNHLDEGPNVTALWAASTHDLLRAIRVGHSVGFEALATCIDVAPQARAVPKGIADIRNLKLLRLLGALNFGSVGRGGATFTFAKEAEELMVSTVHGRRYWQDDLRKIGTNAAALSVIKKGRPTLAVDADTTGRAVEMWSQTEMAMSRLLGRAPVRPAAVGENLAARALKIVNYCVRKGILETSPRDVMTHGFADNAAEAKLLLVFLEATGAAEQVQFITAGKPHQKWVLHTPHTSPPPDPANTEGSPDNSPRGVLTKTSECETR